VCLVASLSISSLFFLQIFQKVFNTNLFWLVFFFINLFWLVWDGLKRFSGLVCNVTIHPRGFVSSIFGFYYCY
jgi:hypothetical protein